MIDLIKQGLATQAATVAAEEAREKLRLENQGARIADDFRCVGCNKRGVIGYCSTCERAS